MASHDNSFNQTLRDAVHGTFSQSGMPADVVKANPEVAAVVSKLIQPRTPRPEQNDVAAVGVTSGVAQISSQLMNRIENNENIFSIFPDIELAVQVIVTSILSPKDMGTASLNYRCDETPIPPGVLAKMNKTVRDTMDLVYGFTEEQPKIVREALFEKGSHVKLVFPEALVDRMINGDKKLVAESIVGGEDAIFTRATDNTLVPRSIGILGAPGEVQEEGSRRTIMSMERIFDATKRDEFLPSDASQYIHVDGKPAVEFAGLLAVSDNYELCQLPDLTAMIREKELSDTLNRHRRTQVRSTESYYFTHAVPGYKNGNEKRLTPKEIQSAVYKDRTSVNSKPYLEVPSKMNLQRRSVGRPMYMRLPSEAAIPVYLPGDPEKHVGYFCLTDIDGNFITVESASAGLGDQLSNFFNTGNGSGDAQGQATRGASLSQLLVDKARANLAGDETTPTIMEITEVYADIVIRDLNERLRRGIYGNSAKISNVQEIFRVMLSRQLKAQFTRLVYTPAEYVTYYAFKHHANGVGKSNLDELTSITSLRAMLLYSEVWNQVRSSITITNVAVELDPKDTDPQKRIYDAFHLVAKSRQQMFPHGLRRIADMTDWIQTAGIEMTFSGHPSLPKTQLTMTSKNNEGTPVSSELKDSLRDQTYMHFGLTPETMNSANTQDFAVSIEQNGVLFSNRINLLISILSKANTRHVRTVITHDEILQTELKAIIREQLAEVQNCFKGSEYEELLKDEGAFIDYVLALYLESLVVDLPRPETTKLENKKKAFSLHKECVDMAVDAIISDKALPASLLGELNGRINEIADAWKNYLYRKWMAENNFVPEALDIAILGEGNKPMVDVSEILSGHHENIMVSVLALIEKMKAARIAANNDLQNQGLDAPSGGGDGGDYGGGYGNDNSSSDDENESLGNFGEAPTVTGTGGDLDNPNDTPPSDPENPGDDAPSNAPPGDDDTKKETKEPQDPGAEDLSKFKM